MKEITTNTQDMISEIYTIKVEIPKLTSKKGTTKRYKNHLTKLFPELSKVSDDELDNASC